MGVCKLFIQSSYCICKGTSIMDGSTDPSQTLRPPAIWHEVLKHSGPCSWTVQQFLPQAISTLRDWTTNTYTLLK